ncbi:MAG: GNAT family N-acetyltransferase [Chitinophagaceae bacterium]|nr:GNAT family N-acetyltransferase [Chitinophagaceae bacterium]
MHVELRMWEKSDRQALAALADNILIWNNVRDRLPHPYKIQHASEFINFCMLKKPASVLAIHAEGALAGCIGLELQEDISRLTAELGYWVGEPFWNKGIATEAVKQMMEYTALHFPFLVRVYARVFEHNKASMKVLEKNGFHLESIQKRSAVKNNVILDEYVWVKLKEH